MFDLLFLLIVLVTVIVLLIAVVNLLRQRFAQVGKLLLRYGLGLALYFLILISVSLTSPQQVVAMKVDRCFDDWCVGVEDVTMKSELGNVKPAGVFYVVTLKLSNQGRGRPQRVSSAAIHLLDGQGNSYAVSTPGMAAFEAQQGSIPPLTSVIEVGQPIITFLVFDVPQDAADIGLTIRHPVGPAPGLFIIGDEASLFHKPTIVRLP